jgi:2-dehydropantoate 2-reductase
VIDSDTKPTVLVYGAGSVGCYLGGLLDASGLPVTLLGREPLAAAVTRHGLRIEAPDASILIRTTPTVVTALDQISDNPDIVLITTKAYDVETALPELARFVDRPGRPTVLTVQNGVGIDGMLVRALPEARIATAVLTNSVEMVEPGIVRLTRDRGGLALAPVAANPPVEHLARLFSNAGIAVTRREDGHAIKWSKLLLNLMGNATAAVIGWPPALIYQHPGLFRIERAAFLEALRVMRALGVTPTPLPGFYVPVLPWVMRMPAPLARVLIASRAGRGRGDKLPSLRLDAVSGRGRSEIEWLNGAVARFGEEAGVATPVNRRLVRLVAGVTRSETLRGAFAGRPDLLIQNVAAVPL